MHHLTTYQAELEQRQTRIHELEDQSQSLRDTNESIQTELSKITKERDQQTQEIKELRGRASLSQQNWIKERDELISREAYAREEFETAKQAMHDWEMLAMEERALRQNLSDRVAELEEQLSTQQEALDKAVAERDTLTQTVDGLQRALRDIQEGERLTRSQTLFQVLQQQG
jgi:chromosome segregation ATPase